MTTPAANFEKNKRPVRVRTTFSVAVIFLGFAALASSHTCLARDPSALASAGRFTLAIKHRVFDGAQIDSVILVSPQVSMMTDTFGSWLPPEESADGPDFSLHSKRFEKVRFDICRIAKSDAPMREQDWTGYLRRVQRGLGENSTVSEQVDSTNGTSALAIIGWPTREALLIRPASATNGAAMAERHVLACGSEGAVLFVLSGPLDQVTRADEDFRFFLARLSQY